MFGVGVEGIASVVAFAMDGTLTGAAEPVGCAFPTDASIDIPKARPTPDRSIVLITFPLFICKFSFCAGVYLFVILFIYGSSRVNKVDLLLAQV